MNTKPIRASKTVRGILIAVIPMLKHLGVEIDMASLIQIGDVTNNLYMVAVQLVGLILALYGRVVANKPLSIQ